MAQVNAGLTHHEAMRAIFERFFRRSPEHGYSWAEFEADALTILDNACRSTSRDSEVREAAKAVLDHAETDDSFEGEFIDWLVPHGDIERLRAALAGSSEATA